MGSKEQSDEYWKKTLSKEVYEAVRLGLMEEAGTGTYVETTTSGTYECAGCKSRVFDSGDKVVDGSGYATFKVVLEEEQQQVTLVREYSMNGAETTKVLCTECGGHLGVVAGDTVRSAGDLEESVHIRLVHVSSRSIHLRKGFTPRNYPVGFLIVITSLAVGAFFAWSWGETYFNVARHGNIDASIQLWVGDTEVTATTLHLETLDPEAQSVVFGKEAFFVVLGRKEKASQLRLTQQSVDVLWLDSMYRVVHAEHKDVSEGNQTLTPPETAVFALITRVGELPESAFREGYEILVIDKKSLF